uniref:PEHE domain-containing protein n=1 Tax=Gongylonema pulchrum TaxID=637853 RepID=A0A183DJQ2_9BILA
LEKEQERRREDEERAKLDLYRRKQLDLQMLLTTKDNRIGSRELYIPYPSDSRMQYAPQPLLTPYPGIHGAGEFDRSKHRAGSKHSRHKRLSARLKELELLPASTARSPTEKRKVAKKREEDIVSPERDHKEVSVELCISHGFRLNSSQTSDLWKMQRTFSPIWKNLLG